MKFIISRTSNYGESSPHPKAKQEKCEHWHTRTCTEEVFNERFSHREGLWRSKGTDHTITKEGWITRREDDQLQWVIKINSLKELISLSEECKIIVSGIDETYNLPGIEIYDDYRE